MRVLWISHLIPFPPAGGARQRSFGLLSQVAKQHEIIFAGFNQTSFCPVDKLQAAIEGLQQHCHVEHVDSIPSDRGRVHRYALAARSLVTRNPYTINWLDKPAFREKIFEIVRTHAPDILHIDTVSLIPYRTVAPEIPAALNHHNVESRMLLRRAQHERNTALSAYYRQEGRRLRAYEKRTSTLFGAHLACSELDGEALQDISPSVRVEVVPNGVDRTYFRPSSPPPARQPKTAIFAGGLGWYPNASAVRFLIERVWPLIPDADARLTIVGREPPVWLREAALKDTRISVTGWVDDVRPHIEGSSVYVCPIFDGGGTKLKVLDALALGIPLIANPIACEGISVTNGIDVLFAETPQEFANKIVAVWNNPAAFEHIGANGVKLIADKYDIVGIGRRLASIYQELVDARRRRSGTTVAG